MLDKFSKGSQMDMEKCILIMMITLKAYLWMEDVKEMVASSNQMAAIMKGT